MRKIILGLLLTALPLTAGAMECRYSAPRNADLDASGLNGLLLKLGSSDLDIQGVAGLRKVEVRATACASSPSWLKNLQVDSGRSGDRATVIARNNRSIDFNLFGLSYAYLKLQVRVPAALAIDVNSGSGDVLASGLASLDFASGSGNLTAANISGMLALQLGSADVKARQVGNVTLRSTGSGDLRVDGANGNVQAEHSGSGDLIFNNVSGNVAVGSTGSGDVILANIGGAVEIGRTGSGDITADGVGTTFTVHATRSGEIHYKHVKGKVSVPKRSDD